MSESHGSIQIWLWNMEGSSAESRKGQQLNSALPALLEEMSMFSESIVFTSLFQCLKQCLSQAGPKDRLDELINQGLWGDGTVVSLPFF